MKNLALGVVAAMSLASCTNKLATSTNEQLNTPTTINIDLVNVDDDKVTVKVNPGKFQAGETVFYFPKTVPGTYSEDNYGRLIDDFKAFDYKGKEIPTTKLDKNSYKISTADALDYVTYKVNDSYDIKGELDIFSPSGTNILKDKNFVLNLHGFVGYFKEKQEIPSEIIVERPTDLFASTALPKSNLMVSTDGTFVVDAFTAKRYFDVTDHPIFYSPTRAEEFEVDGMKVLLDVYSPNKVYSAKDLLPNIEKMVKAQKNYLGDVNNTDLYAIQLYLSDADKTDANGFGALEHHTSTVVVFPERIGLDYLNQMMTDVVSHEFFHTLTPLNVHSEEVQYFDYYDPEMSQHLWLYEGLTEYFANHFQVHEKLIDEADFYNRMLEKINTAKGFTDTMPFTVMSKNILEPKYEKEYMNVYNKGALIAMCLDIELRELSGGNTGILDLMSKLSAKYGKDTPFKDDELIPEIVEMTSPKIGEFFEKHVTGETPINYADYFAKVGLSLGKNSVETNLFNYGPKAFINFKKDNSIVFLKELNTMLEKLGVKEGDVLLEMNGTAYNLDNIRELITTAMAFKPGDAITFKVERGGQEFVLNKTYETPTFMSEGIAVEDLPANNSRLQLRNNWLFN